MHVFSSFYWPFSIFFSKFNFFPLFFSFFLNIFYFVLFVNFPPLFPITFLFNFSCLNLLWLVVYLALCSQMAGVLYFLAFFFLLFFFVSLPL